MTDHAKDDATGAAGSLHESRLHTVWANLLRVSDLRRDDDFFQCGGHSHLALLLKRELNKEFGLDLKLVDIYKNRTLGAQLELIESALAAIEVTIVYNGSKFSASAISTLAGSLENLLAAVADDPDQRLDDIALDGQKEN